MKVWVAGFGNESRQDDGAGIILAQRIRNFLKPIPWVEVSLCLEHQLLPELAEEMADKDWAIFCDADTALYDQGFSIRPLCADPQLEGFNIHSMGPAWLLSLAQTLGTAPKQALLITLSGDTFDFSDELTEICKLRLDKAEKAFQNYWTDLTLRKNHG